MSKSVALLLVIMFFTVTCLLIIPIRAGSRTIVVPDDYSTIQDAINAADEGDTIFVKKGTYEGPINQTLTINKTLSLIGENANNTKINLHPAWVTTTIFTQTFSGYTNPITIEANEVKLSGFTIASDGGNIAIAGNKTQITGNIITTILTTNGFYQTIAQNTLTQISHFGGSYCNITANDVVMGDIGVSGSHCIVVNNVVKSLPTINGIGIGTGGDFNIVCGNTLRDGGGIGANSVGNIVANNTITNCSWGVSIKYGFSNVVYANKITNTRGAGLTKLEGLNNTFCANYVANNSIGAIVGTLSPSHSGNTTFYHNNFINNTQQAQIISPDTTDYWDYGKEGNYWSNYVGNDINHDDIGDTPYVIASNSQDNFPLMAPFDIENNTVVLPPSEPFPITPIIAVFMALAVAVGGLLIYFKKRNH